MVAWWWIVAAAVVGLGIGFGLGFKFVISGFKTGLRDKNSPLHYAMQALLDQQERKSMETYAATAEKYDELSCCPTQCGHKIAEFFREAVKKCQAEDKRNAQGTR